MTNQTSLIAREEIKDLELDRRVLIIGKVVLHNTGPKQHRLDAAYSFSVIAKYFSSQKEDLELSWIRKVAKSQYVKLQDFSCYSIIIEPRQLDDLGFWKGHGNVMQAGTFETRAYASKGIDVLAMEYYSEFHRQNTDREFTLIEKTNEAAEKIKEAAYYQKLRYTLDNEVLSPLIKLASSGNWAAFASHEAIAMSHIGQRKCGPLVASFARLVRANPYGLTDELKSVFLDEMVCIELEKYEQAAAHRNVRMGFPSSGSPMI